MERITEKQLQYCLGWTGRVDWCRVAGEKREEKVTESVLKVCKVNSYKVYERERERESEREREREREKSENKF